MFAYIFKALKEGSLLSAEFREEYTPLQISEEFRGNTHLCGFQRKASND
jgi:hypothetical protein